jgi:hypothetical protein
LVKKWLTLALCGSQCAVDKARMANRERLGGDSEPLTRLISGDVAQTELIADGKRNGIAITDYLLESI